MLKNKKIAFIGGGAIAEAILRGMLKSGLVSAAQVTVCDVVAERLSFIHSSLAVATSLDGAETAAKADVLFLTVKPQVIGGVLETISPAVAKTTVVISVAAGITIATLQNKLPEVPIVRVMPNTPVAVGEGMSAVALGKFADANAGDIALAVFSSVGDRKSVV